MSDIKQVVNKILEGGDVREALCNKLDEGFSEEFKQEIINNPVNKKIKQIAEKYGYTAGESFLYWYGGINLRINPNDSNSYYPAVYADNISDTIEFRIQTTSYGALNSDDYSEFISCCNDAYNMVKELSKLDFSKLAKTPKDFE